MSDADSSTVAQEAEGGFPLPMILLIVAVLGFVVFWNVRNMANQRAQQGATLAAPGAMGQLDGSLKGLVNHRSEPVSFADLRGKVVVLAYFFTSCPAGCEGVMGQMKELQDEFAADASQLQFVGVSMDPGVDTPEVMTAWGQDEDRGMGDGNWWFVTGSQKAIHDYMATEAKLHVVEREEKLWKHLGRWEHEFKFVLLDQQGFIRYYYDVTGDLTAESHSKKIRDDIRYLLEQR